MQKVYVLHHTHELPGGEEDAKLIGIYGSLEEAEAAITRARLLSGFRDIPDGFDIGEYTLGQDHWIEGFVTWVPE
jgi:hypothetical protein